MAEPLTPAASWSISSSSASDHEKDSRGRTRKRGRHSITKGVATKRHTATGKQEQMSEGEQPAREAQRRRLNTHSFQQVLSPALSPSASRSRSRSPVKQVLHQLRESGNPRIVVDSKSIRKEEDLGAYELLRCLVNATNSATIPFELKSRLVADGDIDLLPSDIFAPLSSANDNDIDMLWQRVQRILRGAHSCQMETKDENAWGEITLLVLRTALFGCDSRREDTGEIHDWVITNIQTQSIAEQHLPRIQTRIHSRKTDFALALSPEDACITQLRRKALRLGLPLSHMSDAFTRTVPIVHPIEVKAASGNAEEAQLQLAVFHAATLSFLSGFDSSAVARGQESSKLPPTLGWTVIGHTWTLYIAWKDEAGNVFVRSPSPPRPIGTASLLNLLTLLSVLKEVFAWLRGEFLPQYAQRLESYLKDDCSALEEESPRDV